MTLSEATTVQKSRGLRFITLLCFPLVLIVSSISWAQVITAQQRKACDTHHEWERCQQLVGEFYTYHHLLGPSPSTPLDQVWGDTTAMSHSLAPKAIRLELSSQLKSKAEQAAQQALQTISTSAAVNQTGGAPTSGASTSLVSKPTTTDFLSLAAESGAFTDTQNGNAITLQANALGLTKYLANDPVFARWRSRAADRIQPLTFTVSLNVAQSGTSTVAASGSATSSTPTVSSILLPTNNASFGSFRASYQLYRPYNPQDKQFENNFKDAVVSNQMALDSATSTIKQAIDNLLTRQVIEDLAENLSSAQSEWHQTGADAERRNDFEAFVAAYERYDNAVGDYILSRPDAPKEVLALANAVDAFNEATYTVLNQARGTALATFTYTYSAPPSKPATHEFTAVLSGLFRGGTKPSGSATANATGPTTPSRTFFTGAQLTANFTASIYAELPSGARYGRLRDLQVSSEFDKPFGGTIAEPRGIVSLAGYGQYQYDPTVLNINQGNLLPGTNITLPGNAQVLLGTSGWLGVVQGKITFNLSKGLTIPVALKWSNKTDLLDKNDVRGQVGLSYDLSALPKLITSKQ